MEEKIFTTTHFTAKEGEPFDWKEFQKHMGWSDEEVAAAMKDPKKSKYCPIMCRPETQTKWLIAEVVESHACGNGLKVGDRLYFEGFGNLNPERSSHWCPGLMPGLLALGDAAINLYFQGKDLNKLYPKHFSCYDAGSKYGWGQVVVKVYVVDRSDLDKLP
jgi:hypothetical protein